MKKERIEDLKKEIKKLKKEKEEEDELKKLVAERDKLKYRKIVGFGKSVKKGFVAIADGAGQVADGIGDAGKQFEGQEDILERVGLGEIGW